VCFVSLCLVNVETAPRLFLFFSHSKRPLLGPPLTLLVRVSWPRVYQAFVSLLSCELRHTCCLFPLRPSHSRSASHRHCSGLSFFWLRMKRNSFSSPPPFTALVFPLFYYTFSQEMVLPLPPPRSTANSVSCEGFPTCRSFPQPTHSKQYAFLTPLLFFPMFFFLGCLNFFLKLIFPPLPLDCSFFSSFQLFWR